MSTGRGQKTSPDTATAKINLLMGGNISGRNRGHIDAYNNGGKQKLLISIQNIEKKKT